MNRSPATLLILCFVSLTGCSHSKFDPTTESKKLLARDAEWSQAAADGKDLEKILSYWSDDAQVIEPGQPPLQGKPALRAFVSESLKTPGFHIHWVSHTPVFSPDGNMAYMSAANETKIPDSKGNLTTLHLQGITIWRRDADGVWRCVIDIATEAPPA
jgi:ketosteroid isomerase-like protein